MHIKCVWYEMKLQFCGEHCATQNPFVSHKLDYYMINFVVHFFSTTRISMHNFFYSTLKRLSRRSRLLRTMQSTKQNLCRQIMLRNAWLILYRKISRLMQSMCLFNIHWFMLCKDLFLFEILWNCQYQSCSIIKHFPNLLWVVWASPSSEFIVSKLISRTYHQFGNGFHWKLLHIWFDTLNGLSN